MSEAWSGTLTIAALIGALAVVHVPLGTYLARVFTSERHLAVERVGYRLARVDPDADQRWTTYLLSVLGFSTASILVLYLLQRCQDLLPLSLGFDAVPPGLAFNTAVSFVTNTNWQAYSGESTMGHLVQMVGLAVQNFLSAAVGLSVAIALLRGFTRSRTERIGNFWVDLTRATVRVLLPIAAIGALVLIATGVVQNFAGAQEITTLSGGTQSIVGGPIASQEVIKELGTNGGGFFNANSAHPFENPNAISNFFQLFLILLIPFSLPRTLGLMAGDKRQGYAILAVMGVLWLASVALVIAAETAAAGTVPQAVGAASEGKEQRFAIAASGLFAATTTATSTGAVNSFHDSYTAFGGGITLLNMMLGEVSPGGVGTGLYGMLTLAVLAVFLAGLMVGRTPEYLGKKIGRREITLVALSILAMPAALLIGAGLAMSFETPRASILNPGAHGLSEVLYAFTSASNNNGSAFAGISVNTTFYNTALGICMLIGRFLPIVFVIALAGALATQQPVPRGEGTLPTHTPLFASLLTAVVLIVAGLTFFPALALGPISEGLL